MGFTKIDLDQRSAEWKDFRRSGIGGSDIAVIMGDGAYKMTPLKLYEQKTLLHPPEIEVNYAMLRGIEEEPKARARMEQKLNCPFPPMCVRSEEHPWMIGSLDGYNEQTKILLEIKYVGRLSNQDETVVHQHWIWQIQHCLAITGAPYAILVVTDGIEDRAMVIDRDEEKIEVIIKKGSKFWKEHIIAAIPPDMDDDDYIDIHSDDWEDLENELITLEPLLDRYEAIKKSMKELSEGHSAKGAKCKLTWYNKAGTIDYSKVPELKDVDLEPYRKPPSRCARITVD